MKKNLPDFYSDETDFKPERPGDVNSARKKVSKKDLDDFDKIANEYGTFSRKLKTGTKDHSGLHTISTFAK